jgi:hypothetical protein
LPDRTGVVPTANQLAQQEKFRLAALYGKAVMADAEKKAIYTDIGEKRGTPAFALMVADFLNAPAVDTINLAGYTGQIGSKIVVRASDDIQVAGVNVAIRDQDGVVLEQGAAVKDAGGATYTYTATTALQAGICAHRRSGHGRGTRLPPERLPCWPPPKSGLSRATSSRT